MRGTVLKILGFPIPVSNQRLLYSASLLEEMTWYRSRLYSSEFGIGSWWMSTSG